MEKSNRKKLKSKLVIRIIPKDTKINRNRIILNLNSNYRRKTPISKTNQ